MEEDNNLWSTDEVVDEADMGKTKLELAIERAKGIIPDADEPIDDVEVNTYQEEDDNPVEQFKEETFANAPVIDISEEQIQEKIQAMLAPMVEKIVREKIDSVIEKISWEVIPDLAENLIKKELKQLSEEVLQDN